MTLRFYSYPIGESQGSGPLGFHVEVNDTTLNDVAIGRNGWKQAGPEPGPEDIWYDVTEDVRANLLAEQDTDRRQDISKLGVLSSEARRLQDSKHNNHLNPGAHVIVKAQSQSENEPRWALVRDISIPKLSAAHYSSRSADLRFQFTREGLWRGIEPGQSPVTLTSDYLSLLEGVGSGWSTNTVLPSAIDGDAPGLCIIRLRPLTGDGSECPVKIIQRTADSNYQFLNAKYFYPATDAQPAELNLVDISNFSAPFSLPRLGVDQVHQVTAGDSFIRWDLDTDHPAGTYSIFVLYAYDGPTPNNGEFTARAEVTTGWDAFVGEDVVLDKSTSTWRFTNIGTTSIPHKQPAIRGQLQTADTTMSLWFSVPTDTAYIAGIYLVPEDSPGFEVKTSIFGDVTVDGEIQRVYLANTSGNPITIPVPGNIYGSFPTITPFKFNRFLVMPYLRGLGSSHSLPNNDQFTTYVKVDYIPRYKYLR